MVTEANFNAERREFHRKNAELYPGNPARDGESMYNTDEEIRLINQNRRMRVMFSE